MKLIKELHGGKRNLVRLYKVGKEYVVKKSVRRSNHFDFYECEKQTLLSLNHADLSPKLLDYNDDDNSLIMSYISGKHMSFDFKNYKLLLERLNELHSVSASNGFSFRRNPESDLDDILRIFNNLNVGFSAEAEQNLKTYYAPNIFNNNKNIHGSLIPSNILINNNNIYFVDLEMASKNNPFLDIAYISAFIPKENVPKFITTYASITNTDKELAKNEFNYSRYHLCALSLGLFLKDLKSKEHKDKDFIERSEKFIKHLSNDYFSDYSGFVLREHFKNMDGLVNKYV